MIDMEICGVAMSCGVSELSNLPSNPKDVLFTIGDDFYNGDRKVAFVMWSDIFKRNYNGNKLYHYIKKNFPDSALIRTKRARNPNSGNVICVYIWKIPRGFKKWWKKNCKEEIKEKKKAEAEWWRGFV